jgi:UDPglucose 6-dehydrogenase
LSHRPDDHTGLVGAARQPLAKQPERVVVVGAGYVGLVTAVGLATLGHDVTVVEARPERRERLAGGQVPLFEAGLQEAFDQARSEGLLRVAAAPDSVRPGGLRMVCVGTPIDDGGESDLSQLSTALRESTQTLTRLDVVVIRSTIPVGATARLFDAAGLPRERVFTNPEFLRQGSALHDFLHPDRIVVGRFPEADPEALARLDAALKPLSGSILVTDVSSAELIKNGANAFLALKLSFASELAALSEEYGADIDDVLDGVTRDPRIGRTYMRPSFGFGGSCLPKELQTLTRAGRDVGLPMHVTVAASESNATQQRRFVDRIARAAGGVAGRRIAILGLAFKAGTDDVRDSPAMHVVHLLREAGADVIAHDPQAGPNAMRDCPDLEIADRAEDALTGADVAAITTEWPQYKSLDWSRIRLQMRQPVIVDGRRLLVAREMRDLGFRYHALGSPDPTFVDRVGR